MSPYPSRVISSQRNAEFVDLSLTKCVQSIQTAAGIARQVASSKGESAATETVPVDGFNARAVPDAPLQVGVDDDAPIGTPDSHESCETSCLDREVRRLRVLKSYLGVLDADHGNKFERLTALACRIFRTPMAMVTIADLNKQYCVSSRGLDSALAMKSPFCSQAVSEECDLMVVNDATKDTRFSGDPHVTGYPKVRFYAGAPLICPEGYRLGTLCVMDSTRRTNPVTLDEKQSLMELAAMAMDNLVELRTKKEFALRDPSQQIACTAHDLLTPLTGIALSLSLLREDESLQGKLTHQQRDMIETAANCSTVMNSICHKTMNVFREQERQSDTGFSSTSQQQNRSTNRKAGPSTVKTSDLVKNLNMVIEPFPKHVPVIITVDSEVPQEFVGDDMKIFRSASNFLTNACAKTQSGSIRLRIQKRTNSENNEDELVFECEDTGPCVDEAQYAFLFKPVYHYNEEGSVCLGESVQSSGLGLYSVATQIESLGGKYGFRPRGYSQGLEPSADPKETGSIFWFSIPLVPPSDVEESSQGLSEEESDPKRIHPQAMTRKRSSTFISRSISGRLSDLLDMDSPQAKKSKTVRSDQSLNRLLNSEDALMAFARTPSVADMKNAEFRFLEGPKRVSQALVIEDSIVVRKNLARVLTKLGFEVTQAVNGMEGLRELKASLFDLVLCDFLMPVMDGLDCIQQYRQWEAVNRSFFKQYIIGISAHANDKDMNQGFKIGMNGFRSKPLTFKDIEELKKADEFSKVRVQLDKLGHEIEFLKQQKTQPESEKKIAANPNQKVCLVIEASTAVSKLAEIAPKAIDWKIVSVPDSDSALRLLKMRNWDAVLVDDDLGCSRCISIFREWEKTHRVNRQRNVVLLSANYVSPADAGTSFQVPTGFNGALAKPLELKSLESFFNEARTSWEIVTR